MKTLYLECNMGAAGDMLMGALLELHPRPQDFLQTINGLGIPGVSVVAEKKETCGILGTHIRVTVNGTEEGHGYGCTHGHSHAYAYPNGHEQHHAHEDAFQHVHGCEYGQDHVHEYDHNHPHEHVHGHGRDHTHEDTHHYDHAHGYEDAHDHGHDHTHEDAHHHDHAHVHGSSHHHASMEDISELIGRLELPAQVRQDALEVYASIAQAESKAHGRPVAEIHFHEVGTLDAVADVVGVCLLIRELGVESIVASPVHVGSGHVHCAHGILPVPAPATATLLQGIPTYGGEVAGELCTPTGAALLRHFVTSYGPMPVMAVEQTGHGVGTKEFSRANLVRAMLGTRVEQTAPTVSAVPMGMEEIAELTCNVDDMTAEDMSFAAELLREAGALEVYTTPAGMKKDRAGTVFTCVCRREDRENMARMMFRHLSTLGIREALLRRYVMERRTETRQTELGAIRVKVSRGWGAEKEKAEFEDLRAIAKETGMSLREIRDMLC